MSQPISLIWVVFWICVNILCCWAGLVENIESFWCVAKEGKDLVDISEMVLESVPHDLVYASTIILSFQMRRERFVSIKKNVLTNRTVYFSILKDRVKIPLYSRNRKLLKFADMKRIIQLACDHSVLSSIHLLIHPWGMLRFFSGICTGSLHWWKRKKRKRFRYCQRECRL